MFFKKKYDRAKAQEDLKKSVEYYEGLIVQLQGYVKVFKELQQNIEKIKEYEPKK